MGEQDARFRIRADGRPRSDRLIDPLAAAPAALLALLDGSVGRVPGPVLRPRPAAALLVIDASGAEPRILMGRRNPKLAFMPGYLVFPGGRRDSADKRMRPAGDLTPNGGGSTPGLRALALTAIRETFEETGYLIGARGTAEAPPGAWTEFIAHGVVPSLDGVRFVARAVTPPGHVRRFDTAFFRVDAARIADRARRILGSDDELIDVDWIAASALDTLPTLAITRVILAEALREPPHDTPRYSCPRRKWRRDA